MDYEWPWSEQQCPAETWVPRTSRGGVEVVGASRFEAGPLSGGTSVATHNLLAFKPAGRRVLPLLLPPVGGQVEQPVAVIHRLDAAAGSPVGFEHIRGRRSGTGGLPAF